MNQLIRSFIAIELSPSTQQNLALIQNHFKYLDVDVKWVRHSNIHVTLKFLGEISPEQVAMISDLLKSCFKDKAPFPIEINHIGAFPKIERPRVIWAGVGRNADQIIELADILENQLSLLHFKKDKEKFVPHLTIGRIRSPKNISKLSAAIQEYHLSPIQQQIEKIIFFKSTLTPQGPIYEALKEIMLK